MAKALEKVFLQKISEMPQDEKEIAVVPKGRRGARRDSGKSNTDSQGLCERWVLKTVMGRCHESDMVTNYANQTSQTCSHEKGLMLSALVFPLHQL